jgi:hypothetical protein
LKYYNYNKNGVSAAVLWDPVLAPELFDRIKNDRALVEEAMPDPTASPTTVNKFESKTAADNPCAAG